MKPLTKISETTLDSGSLMELWERDGSYFIMVDGFQTDSSFSHGSDDAAAELAASPVKRANQPSFLINGLGLGFRLSELLEQVNKERAEFIVAEPNRDLVRWHETVLKELHPGFLHDPRVVVEPVTALVTARKNPKAFHAILIKSTHARCEMSIGEASDYFSALKQGGLLLVTVSKQDTRLKRTLMKAGFDVSEFAAPVSHKGKKTSFHTIVIARKGQFASPHGRRA